MNGKRFQRRWIILAFVLAVAALAAGVWRYAYLQALEQLEQRAEADLALASDRLSTQLQVYQELAVLMADHPSLDQLEDAFQRAEARALLLGVSDKTAALDVMFADVEGQVLVTANGLTSRDVSQEPHFRRAMQGALGIDHGVREPLNRRAYYFAAPVFASSGQVRGALIVVADVEDIEQTWPGRTPAVFFTDSNDEVFITNRSELLFWKRLKGTPGLLPQDGRTLPFQSGFTGEHNIWALDWGPYLPQYALHLRRDLPVIGMSGEILVDAAPARRLAGLQAAAVAAICLAFGALLFLATERRRALALANTVLESRVDDRTQALSETNAQLRREVTEREEAEAALKRAQDDLIQAGKLSALGQMSAGISHELNQPLMAIRSFAENGAQFLERGRTEMAVENLGRISELARRMGRIIKNLRSFSRQESEAAMRVDVVAILEAALELTGPRLRQDGVTLLFDQPDNPVWVRGGEVRLGQVFVNLIANAADAMSNSQLRELSIEVVVDSGVTVIIRDTGSGIDLPDSVFDPFYSTKEVGASEGMGLGLSISYAIVQSFGGDIRGENALDCGAVFTVQLESWHEEKAA